MDCSHKAARVYARLYAQASEGSNQCRGGNAAVAGQIFFAQPPFQRIDIELAFLDDSLGDGARQDRSQGFNEPLVIEISV